MAIPSNTPERAGCRLLWQSLRFATAVVLLAVFTFREAQAVTKWNVANGSWFDTGNWTAGLPNSTTDAFIDNGGTSQVLLPTATAQDVLFGDTAVGILEVLDGGTLSNSRGWIGRAAGSEGTVTVTGDNSAWTNSSILYVADQGIGQLIISAGGTVSIANGLIGSSPGSEGTVTVTGEGSTWTSNVGIAVGYSGAGILVIEDGGSVSAAHGYVGMHGDSRGTVAVTGLGSNWTNSGELSVGGYQFGLSTTSRGELMIANGGQVSNSVSWIGGPSGSEGIVTVTGSGSAWIHSSVLVAGNWGKGNVVVAEGGQVSSTRGIIGRFFGSEGMVAVTGHGSEWTMSGRLSIGGDGSNGGTGTLTVGPEGTVLTDGETWIFPNGLLKLEGGTLSTQSIEFQGTGGQFNWTSGTLHVGTYNGNLSNPGGTLAPGQSAGSTTITGNYTQGPAATLEIEIGGLAAGMQYDIVNVTGNAALGGQLELAMLGDYVPLTTDTFTILTAGGILNGTFSNAAPSERLATVDGRGSFLLHYNEGGSFDPNHIVLTDFLLAGDYNEDGTVSAADYTLWRDSDNTPEGYSAWQRNFGLAYGTGSSEFENAAVPEPTAWQLLVAASIAGLFARRYS